MAASVWKGHLTFGLVSLPIRLHSAARAQTLSFNLLHKDDHSRIRQVTFCQAEDKPVPRSELVKGYEYEKDRYVVVDDEDIKKVAPKTSKVMEILEFVPAPEVDPIYLESSYYLAPEEGGEKPYALLFAALRETQYVGVAKIAMHNREHIVILRPGERGIVLHTMYFEDEVRKIDEFRTDQEMVKEKELALAKMLIESLASTFEPGKYHDTYRENLKELIQAKLDNRKVVEIAPPPVAPVIDIMEALKRSLEIKKKPVATAPEPVTEIAATAAAGGESKTPRRKRSTA